MIADEPRPPRGRLLENPWPWSVLSGLGLVVALSLGPAAPAWLFWGAVVASCLGAFIATWLGRARALN